MGTLLEAFQMYAGVASPIVDRTRATAVNVIRIVAVRPLMARLSADAAMPDGARGCTAVASHSPTSGYGRDASIPARRRPDGCRAPPPRRSLAAHARLSASRLAVTKCHHQALPKAPSNSAVRASRRAECRYAT